MLKSCKHCGRIHDSKQICAQKAAVCRRRKKDDTEQIKFRNRNVWKKKREEVKARDHYMCQACLHKLTENGSSRINGENLSVHHIIPLVDDADREYALDDDWLITLCEYHHKLADAGAIKAKVLHEIAVANGHNPPGTSL